MDGVVLRKAVETIHSMPSAYADSVAVYGHLGGGSISMSCANCVPRDGGGA